MNDEPLANIALWHATLFCLYHGWCRSVLGKNSWTYSNMFGHYIHAFVLIRFSHSAE